MATLTKEQRSKVENSRFTKNASREDISVIMDVRFSDRNFKGLDSLGHAHYRVKGVDVFVSANITYIERNGEEVLLSGPPSKRTFFNSLWKN